MLFLSLSLLCVDAEHDCELQIGMSQKPSIPDDISPEAVDFLNRTFDLDHNKRPSAAELLKHPWIAASSPLGV